MTEPEFRCVVDALPRPGGSKRAFVVGGRARLADANKHVGQWKDSVVSAAIRAMQGRMPFEGPLRLDVHFALPRPKGHFGKRGLKPKAPTWPDKKPDATKLLRSTEDALTDAGVWRDDSQVVQTWVVKAYDEVRPHAVIEVRRLSQERGEPF